MKSAVALFLLAMFVGALPCAGQTITLPYQPYGRVISAAIRPADLAVIKFRRATITAAEAAEAEQTAFSFGSLDASDGQNSNSGGFSLGYGSKWAGHDFVVVGAYSRSMPDTGSDQDSAAAFGQVVFTKNKLATVSGSVTLVYDPGSYKLYNPVLAAEHSFIPDTLKATLNLGWTSLDPKGVSTVSDLQPAVGLALSPDKHHLWAFGADYVFDNDVDLEDTGSAAVTRTITRWSSELKISVKKHRSFALSFTKYF